MGCNCGGSRPRPTPATTKEAPEPVSTGQVQSFQLVMEGGRTQVFGSRLEADAARVRAGGRGRVVPTTAASTT